MAKRKPRDRIEVVRVSEPTAMTPNGWAHVVLTCGEWGYHGRLWPFDHVSKMAAELSAATGFPVWEDDK